MDLDELQAEYEKAKLIIANLEGRVARMETMFCMGCSGISLIKRMAVMVCSFCDAVNEAGELPGSSAAPSPDPAAGPTQTSSPWPTTPALDPEPVQDINAPPSVPFTAVKELAYYDGKWWFLSRSNNEYGLYRLYKQSDGTWWYNIAKKIVVQKADIATIVANPWQPIPGGG